MALFKPMMGNRSALDSQIKQAGYAWFCIDDGSFHIDYVDAEGNIKRKQINAAVIERLEALENFIYSALPMFAYEGADMIDAGLITEEDSSAYNLVDLGAII